MGMRLTASTPGQKRLAISLGISVYKLKKILEIGDKPTFGKRGRTKGYKFPPGKGPKKWKWKSTIARERAEEEARLAKKQSTAIYIDKKTENIIREYTEKNDDMPKLEEIDNRWVTTCKI